MARILTTIHLSDIQKEVLAKVKASPTSQVAWEEVTNAAHDVDQNFAAARDVLGNLGLLEVGDGTLEVTNKGEDVMRDENLTDDMGELTDEGRTLASIDRAAIPNQPEAPPDGANPNQDEFGGLPMESLSLIRDLNERAEETIKLNEMMNGNTIDIDQVTDLDVDGVDRRDYPDFADAYFSYGVWKDTGQELTDDELSQLTDEYPDVVHQMALDSVY